MCYPKPTVKNKSHWSELWSEVCEKPTFLQQKIEEKNWICDQNWYNNRKLVHVHREAEEGNFRLYVVGKDGKVKIEGKGIPPNAIRFYGREGLSQTFGKILDNLFEEIDTLPIRKREIRLDKDCSPPEEEEEIEE